MLKRNKKGQFIKGIHSSPKTEFKKGFHPKTEFKKGCIPWNKVYKGKSKIGYKKYRIEHLKKYNKERYQKNKVYRREYARIWRKENPERKREYYKGWSRKQRKTNPRFRLDSSIAISICRALKGKKAGRKWEELVGYTIEDLIKHLESLFEPWMSWNNYGKWEIDHKKPKSLFRYEKPEDKEFQECWALENLQPLEKIANIKKGNNYGLKIRWKS